MKIWLGLSSVRPSVFAFRGLAITFYNTPPWWLDSGTRVVNTRRTSLIIDPPDGRLPAMTPEGVKRAADLARAASCDRWT